ncbi:MAG: SBBP repeat-containing protein [Flavobacteriales bacterium]|nr:SBBP repeat-containing protein [Flavobacteriales bacterium]
MNRTLFAFCTLLVSIGVNAQTFEWAKSFGSSLADYGLSIALDASGNVYTTGYFQGTADFDPGAGTANRTSSGGRDIWVQKLDASGNFIWARSFGGSLDDIGRSITVDASGNVYTTGYFQGTADFDPGAGTANITSAGNEDIFIQKLDASGNFLWAKSFGGSLADYGLSIAVDAAGNVYTTGYFQGTADFDPGAGTANHSSAGNEDIFVQKLDTSGNFVWARSFGDSNSDRGNSICVDASSNVYTTGGFDGTVDFDPGAGTTNLTSEGSLDVYVQKLNSTGNFVWTKSFGGSLNDQGFSITVDDSGNVHTTGSFEGTVDFDPGAGSATRTSSGSLDVFVQKLNASGTYDWAISFGASSSDQGYSVTVDASGNVYTTGSFLGTADFDPGSGTANLTSAGPWDVFIQKINASGNFVWAKSFGGNSIDAGNAITVDASGNVYTTGHFAGTVDFDPGVGTANLTSAGNYDVFVQKLSQGVSGILDIGAGIQIRAFPNPSKGLVQLFFEKAFNNVEITLTDFQGKVVFTKQLDVTTNEKMEIEGSAGIYFLNVKTPQGQNVLKLIKE